MVIAFDLRSYDSLGSTNDEAQRLAQAGAAHGTVVTAREQTAGRGRQARGWISPPGNLYASILLRLDLPPARLPELSFVAALAVADAVDRFLPGSRRARLKWPNDVLVAGAKISGILIERTEDAVIVGIGLNVRHRPQGTPYPAISLAEAIGESRVPGDDTVPSIDAVRTGVLDAFASRLGSWEQGGFKSIRAAWLARAHPFGTPLNVHVNNAIIAGAFAGLDPGGALLLDTQAGRLRLLAGEVRSADQAR